MISIFRNIPAPYINGHKRLVGSLGGVRKHRRVIRLTPGHVKAIWFLQPDVCGYHIQNEVEFRINLS